MLSNAIEMKANYVGEIEVLSETLHKTLYT